MGTTPRFHLPYPESTDPPDGPLGFRNLAEATEAQMGKSWRTTGMGWTAHRVSTYDQIGGAQWANFVSLVINNAPAGQYMVTADAMVRSDGNCYIAASLNGTRYAGFSSPNANPPNINWWMSTVGVLNIAADNTTLTWGGEFGFSGGSYVGVFGGSNISVQYLGPIA
jgi:hypothetical protein